MIPNKIGRHTIAKPKSLSKKAIPCEARNKQFPRKLIDLFRFKVSFPKIQPGRLSWRFYKSFFSFSQVVKETTKS